MSNSTWAIVPFRGAPDPKRRLNEFLSRRERIRLAKTMLHDVLTALQASSQISHILLVSRGDEAAQLAEQYHVRHYQEQATSLVSALIEASDYLAKKHAARTTFIVPADVPLICSTDVDLALGIHTAATLLPDRFFVGTNGLICTPPSAFALVFDGQSYVPHLRNAWAAGLEPQTVRIDSFQLDVDTSDDVQMLESAEGETESAKFLSSAGIFNRIAERNGGRSTT